MKIDKIEKLLLEVKKLTNHINYVIIGSLSVIGQAEDPPDDMLVSIDVDLYTKDDHGRIFEINQYLGQGSSFEDENGYYADPVSPNIASFPENWESRLVLVKLNGVNAYFVDINDSAVAKMHKRG